MGKKEKVVAIAEGLVSQGQELLNMSQTVTEAGTQLVEAGKNLLTAFKKSAVSTAVKAANEPKQASGKQGAHLVRHLADMDRFTQPVKQVFIENNLVNAMDLRKISKPVIRDMFRDVEGGWEQIGAFLNYDFSKSTQRGRPSTTPQEGTKPKATSTAAPKAEAAAGKRGRKPMLLSEQDALKPKVLAALNEAGIETMTQLRQFGKGKIKSEFGEIRGALKQIGEVLNYDFSNPPKRGRGSTASVEAPAAPAVESTGKRGRKPVLLRDQDVFSKKVVKALENSGVTTISQLKGYGVSKLKKEFGEMKGALNQIGQVIEYDFTNPPKRGRGATASKEAPAPAAKEQKSARHHVKSLDLTENMIVNIRDTGYSWAEQLQTLDDDALMEIKGIGPKNVEKVRGAVDALCG